MKNNFSIVIRQLLKLGALALGTVIATKVTNSQANPISAKKTIIAFKELGKDITPELVLAELLAGNKRFVANKLEAPNQDPARLK